MFKKFIKSSHSKDFIGRFIAVALLLLIAVITITTLLFGKSGQTETLIRSAMGVFCTIYLLVGLALIYRGHATKAYWMLLIILIFTGLFILFYRGTQSAVGLLTLSAAVIIPGILLKSSFIIPVTLVVVLSIFVIQTIHTLLPYPPIYSTLPPISYGQVFVYAIILGFISLVSYLSIQRSEYSLRRARQAEKKLITQKNRLKDRLAQESAKLRANQFKEVQQLYTFAALGQNAVATLHELSNHLSVLGIDIDDLSTTYKHSRAVIEAQNSFQQATAVIKTARKQLDTYGSGKLISPYNIVKKVVNEIGASPHFYNIALSLQSDQACKQIKTFGEPIALAHIITILIKNSVEACSQLPNAAIDVFLVETKSNLRITVTDSGAGLSAKAVENIFSPQPSTKPTGLGAGLFIAQSLTKTHFKGNLSLISNGIADPANRYLSGATFSLYLPLTGKYKVKQ